MILLGSVFLEVIIFKFDTKNILSDKHYSFIKFVCNINETDSY